MPGHAGEDEVKWLQPASTSREGRLNALHTALARADFAPSGTATTGLRSPADAGDKSSSSGGGKKEKKEKKSKKGSSTTVTTKAGGLKGVSAAAQSAIKASGAGAESGRSVADSLRTLATTMEPRGSGNGAAVRALEAAADALAQAEDASADYGGGMRGIASLSDLVKTVGKPTLDSVKKFDKLRDKAIAGKQKVAALEEASASVSKTTEADASAKTAYTAYADAIEGNLESLRETNQLTNKRVLEQTIELYDTIFAAFLEGHEKLCEVQASVASKIRADAVSASNRAVSAARPADQSGSGSDDDTLAPVALAVADLRPLNFPPPSLQGDQLTRRARTKTVDSDDSSSSESSSESSEEDLSVQAASARQLVKNELQSQRERKRDVLETLFTSEKSFAKEQETLTETFAASIRKLSLDQEATKISTADVSQIFGNTEKLRAIHQRFKYAVDEVGFVCFLILLRSR
jgi:flagellar biosynthesis/type III secretory pathway chaperone